MYTAKKEFSRTLLFSLVEMMEFMTSEMRKRRFRYLPVYSSRPSLISVIEVLNFFKNLPDRHQQDLS